MFLRNPLLISLAAVARSAPNNVTPHRKNAAVFTAFLSPNPYPTLWGHAAY